MLADGSKDTLAVLSTLQSDMNIGSLTCWDTTKLPTIELPTVTHMHDNVYDLHTL